MSKPAFPRPYSEILNDDGGKLQQFADEDGMSLLDWFAGQALISHVAASNRIGTVTAEECAEASFIIAEAMIEESERRNK